jgi:hypothetical protein
MPNCVLILLNFIAFCSLVFCQSECKQVENSGVIPLVVASGPNLVTCEEGLSYLRNTLGDDRLYITVVVGPARQGKSLFLNNIAGNNPAHGKGFSVGHTPMGHTKGFWISPKHDSSVIKTKSGENVVSLFLDTEGFAAIGNLAAYDPKLCAIVSIFASNLIYNTANTISMNDLNFLSSLASLDTYFQKTHQSNFSTPPLTWVLQNFELLLDDFMPPNEIGYLKHVLSDKRSEDNLSDGDKLQIESYNALLNSITEKFSKDRDVGGWGDVEPGLPPIVLLDHPSRMHKKTELDKLPFHSFSPEYQAQILRIREQIESGARTKQLGPSIPLTGRTFADNIVVLTESLNQLSQVGDAYVRSVAKQSSAAAFEEYNSTALHLESPSRSQAAYSIELGSARDRCLLQFDKSCVGNLEDSINREVRSQLVKDMNNEERVLVEKNSNAQMARCHDLAIESLELLSNSDASLCAELCLPQGEYKSPSSEHAASLEESHKNDVITLRKCYEYLTSEYLEVCGPGWCDVFSPSRHSCQASLNKTSVEFKRRMADTFDIRMKGLASQGFASLALFLFVAYPLLSVLACFGIHSAALSRVVTFLVASVAFISMLDGVVWFRIMVCNQTVVPMDGYSEACYYWANELPTLIGYSFNAYLYPFLYRCTSLLTVGAKHWYHVYTFLLMVTRMSLAAVAPFFLSSSAESAAFIQTWDSSLTHGVFVFLVVYSVVLTYFFVSAISACLEFLMIRIRPGRKSPKH